MFPISGENLVGREDCEILLTSPHSSRKHAKLTLAEGLLRIEDLGSANGTYVNDERVSTAELEVGDVVRFDIEEFIVVGPEQPAAAPEEDNRTMLRPAVKKEEPASPPEAAAEPPSKPVKEKPAKEKPAKEKQAKEKSAKEQPAEDKSESHATETVSEEETDEHKGGAWYEKDTPQMTARVDVSDLRDQFADGATQIVRGIPEVEMPSLIGATGQWAGKVFNLTSDAMTLGRLGANIVIDEPSVSTKHAQFVKQGERWKVVDLMSTSGTYVNGKKSQASFLSSGDALRFGRVELRFVIESTDVASRAAPDSNDQLITGTGRESKSTIPAWLYILIGFVAVLAIGAFFLFAR